MRYAVGLLLLALGCLAYAQTSTGGGQSAQKGGAMPMGHDMGQMSPEMKTKCQMMMQAQLTPSDPSALVALKDQLKLTEDQVKKLQAIQEQARKDAAAVLNDEQKQQVAKIPATPDTSTGMHQQMMQMMKDMHGGQGGGQMPTMNCPMMNMMGGNAATRPAQPGSSTPADHGGHSH